jgi:fatty acid desaturase
VPGYALPSSGAPAPFPYAFPPPPGQPPWPGPYPPPYPPPYPVYVAAPPTNGLAIAALVLGILWLWWVGSILAVVFGHIALSQIRQRGQGGHGMAVAGLVLGYIGLGFLALVIVLSVVFTPVHSSSVVFPTGT